jgi:aminopeptidase N
VVSNGRLVEETDLPDDRRLTDWCESVPLAPWLYVLGAARFAVEQVDEYQGRPIQTWVYPQDRDAGFRDFAGTTRQVLEFFGRRIGPFAYEKLANVQSRAVSGGMEAATAIAYGENLVTGDRSVRLRDVVIHELAHQWWGDAVTERDWDDVWLSEGFATYFTLLFIEHEYGRDAFLAGLADSQDRVRAFDEKNPDYRIVHDDLADMRQVTTGQIYQKGSWTLHMLRGLVGDEAFWAGIRAYYGRYRDANASTDDFRRAMEEASGQPLDWFFRQWLNRGGYPKVEGSWRYDTAAQAVEIELAQTQVGDPFDLPIEVSLDTGGRTAAIEHVRLRERRQRFTIPAATEPRVVTLDPNRWVLMDATFVRR